VIEYSFPRYLASKKTVDDRALNTHVWEALKRSLPDKRLEVIEIGAGIGTMIERAVERGLLGDATYTAIDAMGENIAEARRRLPLWAKAQGFELRFTAEGATLQHPLGEITVDLETADVFDFLEGHGNRRWDGLIAHAFLDLTDIPSALPRLLGCLRPDGLCYFTLNFDGATILEPAIDPAFDTQIELLYHRTMDERVTDGRPSGDSQSGRRLFTCLRDAGVEILDSGSSDWVVFANGDGYRADEAYFLHFIVDTIGSALRLHAEIDSARFARWIAERHAQIERGELVYIAHQLDFLGRKKQR